MVAPTELNLQTLRGRTFRGFVQFQIPDGSTWYRLKERQNFSFSSVYSRAQHYSDDGRLALDPSGRQSTFSLTIKLTSDMFDDVTWTYTNNKLDSNLNIDKQTLSYWLYKNELLDPVEIVFVGSLETLSGPTGNVTDKNINIKFKCNPNSFTMGLGANGGSPEMTITGNVLEITNAVRANTTEQ
jgi:hypothetical protein